MIVFELDIPSLTEHGIQMGENVFSSMNELLKRIERVEIGNECLKEVNRFVIDGLNELKSVIIGKNSFSLSNATRKGNKCLIMNCNELSEIHIGDRSFYWYESLELKNLPSLTVLEMGRASFCNCHWIVVESINDELMMNEI